MLWATEWHCIHLSLHNDWLLCFLSPWFSFPRWWPAEDHVAELQQFVRMSQTTSRKVYHVLDIFGASKRVTKAFQSKGYRGFAFDVKLSRDHDLTSRKGVMTLLRKVMEKLGWALWFLFSTPGTWFLLIKDFDRKHRHWLLIYINLLHSNSGQLPLQNGFHLFHRLLDLLEHFLPRDRHLLQNEDWVVISKHLLQNDTEWRLKKYLRKNDRTGVCYKMDFLSLFLVESQHGRFVVCTSPPGIITWPRLQDDGLLMCGPPCSMFGPASSSIHRRSVDMPEGDLSRWKVRLSNRIWGNFVTRKQQMKHLGLFFSVKQRGNMLLQNAWACEGEIWSCLAGATFPRSVVWETSFSPAVVVFRYRVLVDKTYCARWFLEDRFCLPRQSWST